MAITHSLNILQTCFSRSWGGLELQALEVAKQLQRRGHHVWLACCTGSRLAEEAQSSGIVAVPLDVTGYFHPRAVWRLSRIARHNGIAVIHCQLSKDIATIVPAVRLSGRRTPIVLSKRVGSYVSKRDLFHRFTYAHVSKVLAISSVIHRNVLDTTPITSDRVMTLHDAVDTDLFSPGRTDRRRVREEFGFDDSTILVGFAGRFSPGKGHEEFLEAADTLRKRYANVRFLVVGEASFGEHDYARNIHAMCERLDLGGAVTFTGFRKDIADVMASFDIFAFPSHAESFGMVLIEAMAMERPVVSTNCDGVLDIVVDGVTGLYVHPRKGLELAEALARLIDDPALRERMGKAGRQRVIELFDQKKQIDRIEQVYCALLTST